MCHEVISYTFWANFISSAHAGSLSHADNITSEQNSIIPANHGGWAAGGHGEGEGFQLHARLIHGDEGHGDAAQDPESESAPSHPESSPRPRRQQPTENGSRPSSRSSRCLQREWSRSSTRFLRPTQEEGTLLRDRLWCDKSSFQITSILYSIIWMPLCLNMATRVDTQAVAVNRFCHWLTQRTL